MSSKKRGVPVVKTTTHIQRLQSVRKSFTESPKLPPRPASARSVTSKLDAVVPKRPSTAKISSGPHASYERKRFDFSHDSGVDVTEVNDNPLAVDARVLYHWPQQELSLQGSILDMAVKEIQKLDRSQYERDLNPEKLELNKKNLHVFPSLAGEDRLRMLSLQNNYISEIKSVSHLSNLACLDLYNNQIESMEPLRELTSLRVLMLGRNRIKTIQGLTILTQLDILDLHHNQIQDLTTGLSTLKSLRILNLENNHITEIPTLTGLQRLAELNVKRNVISSMDKNSHLISLQRLLMDENKFKGLQEIVNVFELSGLAELSLGQNPVADLSMFRLAIIGKMSGLKILNGKRVLEDERRQAYRWIKKGVEKQQLQDKKLVQQEEKKLCLQDIEKLWRMQLEWKEGDPDPRESFPGKTAYVELEGEHLRMYGNGCAVLDKIDPKPITNISFDYLQIQELHPFFRIVPNFDILSTISLGNVHLNRLAQIQELHHLNAIKTLYIDDMNPICHLPLFRLFVISSVPQLTNLNHEPVLDAERQEARRKFGHLRLTRYNTFMPKPIQVEDVHLLGEQAVKRHEMWCLFESMYDNWIKQLA